MTFKRRAFRYSTPLSDRKWCQFFLRSSHEYTPTGLSTMNHLGVEIRARRQTPVAASIAARSIGRGPADMPRPEPHESRARREAVGRARARVVPRRLRAPRGLLRRQGLPGDLGPGAPRHAEGAAGLRSGPEEVVAGDAAVRPRAVRAQADRRGRIAQAARGRPPPVPRRPTS